MKSLKPPHVQLPVQLLAARPRVSESSRRARKQFFNCMNSQLSILIFTLRPASADKTIYVCASRARRPQLHTHRAARRRIRLYSRKDARRRGVQTSNHVRVQTAVQRAARGRRGQRARCWWPRGERGERQRADEPRGAATAGCCVLAALRAVAAGRVLWSVTLSLVGIVKHVNALI